MKELNVSQEILDKIWVERKEALDRLYEDVKGLLKWRIPMYHKVMYWEKIYDVYLSKILNQDKRIDKRL